VSEPKKLKIAVWHNLPSGGARRALQMHVRGLAERGHTLEVWSTSTADHEYLPLGKWAKEHIVPLEVRWKPSRTLPGALVQPYRDTLFNMDAMEAHCREVARQIERRDFDIVLANQCVSYAASYLGRFLALPKVLYLQEPFRLFFEAAPRLPWMAPPPQPKYSLHGWHRRLFDWNCVQGMSEQLRREWESARAYDALLVNSHFSAESVARAYGLPARVCYLGVDSGYFTPDKEQREEFILGIGQFIKHKNIHLVLEAMAQLPAPRPRLVWVGNMADPEYLRQLEAQAQRDAIPFEPRVRLTDDELLAILRRAAFVIYASHLEPFGLAPLEANACGAAVIGLNQGGLRETVQHGVNGLLCESDASSLAAAIAQLWSDRRLAAQLGRNGRALVEERWGEAAAVDRIENHLYRVLAEHHDRRDAPPPIS
jgi:glycosyltransferase involved in cell wall biosynthesis